MHNTLVSRKLLRSIFRRATTVQVDSAIWMKLEAYNIGAKEGQTMLRLVPDDPHQASWAKPQEFSCREIMTGYISGTQLVVHGGTRLSFFKKQLINLLDTREKNP